MNIYKLSKTIPAKLRNKQKSSTVCANCQRNLPNVPLCCISCTIFTVHFAVLRYKNS